jgi:N-acetylmuramate 1-kinase
MSARDAAARRFLSATAWAGAAMAPLPGDASFRRYFRLAGGPSPALLMDAPPPHEDVRSYRRIAAHLVALGLTAPRVHAADDDAGFLLIEDFGDTTFARALAAGAPARPLYELATDALVALHARADAAAIDLPAYDAAAMLEKAALFLDWYMPRAGRKPDAAQRRRFAAAWAAVLPRAAAGAPTLVLRDFFVENLMLAPGRAGAARCGLLDFQDAAIGPRAYDLMSLVEDARRDVPAEIRAGMLARYFAAFPDLDRAGFLAAATVCAAQRHCRVLGVFARLASRDGKPAYLAHVPRLWRLMERALSQPVMAPVKAWFDAEAPPPLRALKAAA